MSNFVGLHPLRTGRGTWDWAWLFCVSSRVANLGGETRLRGGYSDGLRGDLCARHSKRVRDVQHSFGQVHPNDRWMVRQDGRKAQAGSRRAVEANTRTDKQTRDKYQLVGADAVIGRGHASAPVISRARIPPPS